MGVPPINDNFGGKSCNLKSCTHWTRAGELFIVTFLQIIFTHFWNFLYITSDRLKSGFCLGAGWKVQSKGALTCICNPPSQRFLNVFLSTFQNILIPGFLKVLQELKLETQRSRHTRIAPPNNTTVGSLRKVLPSLGRSASLSQNSKPGKEHVLHGGCGVDLLVF